MLKTKISPLAIRTRSLRQGENPIDIDFDASLIEYPEFSGKAHVTGSISRINDRLDLRGQVTADGHFGCTRCAEPFSERISAPVNILFVPSRLAGDEIDPNIHSYDPLSESDLEILEDVRDALILAVPMRHLCKPDCKGLCPNCGKNLNSGTCDCKEETAATGGFAALNMLRERLRAEENFNNN